MNTCSYTGRFNILMVFVNDKEKLEAMIKENVETCNDKSNKSMLFGPKFEEVIVKIKIKIIF